MLFLSDLRVVKQPWNHSHFALLLVQLLLDTVGSHRYESVICTDRLIELSQRWHSEQSELKALGLKLGTHCAGSDPAL